MEGWSWDQQKFMIAVGAGNGLSSNRLHDITLTNVEQDVWCHNMINIYKLTSPFIKMADK